MTQKIADRVAETSTTTGTGTYSLGGAKTGFQAFSGVCATGDTVPYAATDGTNWEVGLGTWTSGSPSTLARTTIYASSNSNAAVSWSSGSKDIFLDIPANFFTGGSVGQQLVSNGAAAPTWQKVKKTKVNQRDPNANDDANAGYLANDYWPNYKTKTMWQCVVNTAGAARWSVIPWSSAPVLDQVPTAISSCVFAGGVKRLYSSYIGPNMDVVRASDSSAQTLNFSAYAGNFDDVTYDAFVAGTYGSVSKLYDQSGNGNDLTSRATANRPIINTYLLAGLRSIGFYGLGNGNVDTNSAQLQQTSISLTANALSFFLVCKLTGTANEQTMFNLGSSSAVFSWYSDYQKATLLAPATDTGSKTDAGPMRSDLAVIGFVSGASGFTTYCNDRSFSVGGDYNATAATGFIIGDAIHSVTSAYPGSMEVLAAFVFNKALSSTEVQALTSACYMNFPDMLPQQREFLDILGDSISVGYNSNNNLNYTYLLSKKLSNEPGVYNFGSPFAKTSDWNTAIAKFTQIFKAGETHTVLVALGGNDFINSVSAATAYTNLTSILSAIRTAAASAGTNLKVGALTTLTNSAITGSNETARTTYNASINANAAGFDFIIDIASDATISSTWYNTGTLSVDTIHPSTLAHSYLADFAYAKAITIPGLNWGY